MSEDFDEDEYRSYLKDEIFKLKGQDTSDVQVRMDGSDERYSRVEAISNSEESEVRSSE